MDGVGENHLLLKSPDQYRRELMIEYAFAEYLYVITEEEADEIFFKPHWWRDVDAFVKYMQDVNFGTPVAGTTNVALPSTMRLYTDAELDAMEETGDFYPPTPELSPSSSDDDDPDSDSFSAFGEDEFLLEEEEWEEEEEDSSEEEEEPEMIEYLDEREEEPLPLYEPISKWAQRRMRNVSSPPPSYDESQAPSYVDGLLAALRQDLNELGLVHHDHEEYQQEPIEQPVEQPEAVEDEPEDEQLDDLSRWLESLAVPATPLSASADDTPTTEDEDEDEHVADAQLPLLSPISVMEEAAQAVEVTMQVATPAVVVVRKKESVDSLVFVPAGAHAPPPYPLPPSPPPPGASASTTGSGRRRACSRADSRRFASRLSATPKGFL
ncbi:hypothetical protein PG990_012054 [Apiospora arundinis]